MLEGNIKASKLLPFCSFSELLDVVSHGKNPDAFPEIVRGSHRLIIFQLFFTLGISMVEILVSGHLNDWSGSRLGRVLLGANAEGGDCISGTVLLW